MRTALRFTLTAAVLFALAMAPWPGLRPAYAAWFRGVNEVAFSLFWLGGDVRFERHDVAGEAADTFVRVVEDGGAAWYTLVESTGAGWLPTAVFLALALATPIPWRRKLRAVLLGALLVQAYVTWLVWVNLLEGLTNHSAGCASAQHAAWLGTEGWRGAVETAVVLFRLEPTVFLAAPVLAWLLVSVRRADLEAWAADR
jgi:hypothetical protein